jgi:release factor glutamine methyltransferase
MQARDFIQQIAKQLFIYDEAEAKAISEWLVEHFYGLSRNDLLLNIEIKQTANIDLDNLIARLNAAEPIQYITGEAFFYGLKFKVSEAVLIPRPETEELVELILKHAKSVINPTILDIGTGSGCIAVSLAKKYPDAIVSAWDISEAALEIAKKNAVLNQVKVNFEKVDILNVNQKQLYDIVVSNPPYISQSEAMDMRANVLNHEPHLALFVENDNPLVFYKAIAAFCKTNLKSGGRFFVEINEALGKETAEVFQNEGCVAIEIIKDMYGKERFVMGSMTDFLK